MVQRSDYLEVQARRSPQQDGRSLVDRLPTLQPVGMGVSGGQGRVCRSERAAADTVGGRRVTDGVTDKESHGKSLGKDVPALGPDGSLPTGALC